MRANRRTSPSSVLAVALASILAAAVLVAGCSKDRPPAEGATTISVQGHDVAAIERKPAKASSDEPTVLFLHGQAYSSRIWDDRGILDAVTAAGDRAVAVDLPGHGDTPDRPELTGDDADAAVARGVWLRDLIDELGGPERVVVVSPSMSGSYSLQYLSQFATERLAGFVPVAPVGIDGFRRPDEGAIVPAVAIWGSKDPSYSPERAQHLVDQLKGGSSRDRTEVIEGASHAAYDDHPEEFTALLTAFLASLDR